MSFRSSWLCLAVLGAVAPFAACSSSAPPGSDAGFVPPNPGGPPPDGKGTSVFAISKLYFGDNGPNAWKKIGLDIDGKRTDDKSTDVCTRLPGSFPFFQTDGDNGIDNEFGLNLVPFLASAYGYDVFQAANEALSAGDATLLVRIDDLGSGQNYAPLPASSIGRCLRRI